VLKVLENAGTMTVSDLAQKIGISTAGATGLLDRLVRANLVERTRDQSDRRIVWVRLSGEGANQLAEACRLRRSILAELMASLTPDEVHQFMHLFEKISRNAPAPVPGSDLCVKESKA
ncbi:MAG TPA: MarR family transcriptional regulator, partial [Symbiobacteriaceae bacterium]|nr:MarR family transcriptional regulator [Symbiobacteriaceae bacterium]